VIIEQAKGILAERMRITPDQAFIELRAYSRNHNYPLTQQAADVISGTVDMLVGTLARARPGGDRPARGARIPRSLTPHPCRGRTARRGHRWLAAELSGPAATGTAIMLALAQPGPPLPK